MVSGDSSTPRAASAKQEENAQARVSEMSCRALLPMASTACGRERCCFSPGSGCPGNRAFLRTEKFHLMQGVLSHMAEKEVEREGETDASRL